MEFMHTSKGLSNFVSKEMNDVLLDDSFASKSQEIFCKLSEIPSIMELDNWDSFSQLSLNNYNSEELVAKEDFKFSDKRKQTTEDLLDDCLAALSSTPSIASDESLVKGLNENNSSGINQRFILFETTPCKGSSTPKVGEPPK